MAETLESRIETYRQSWNSGQLDRLLSHWVDEGLDYSDYCELPPVFFMFIRITY
jgi:hypothetical protein